MKAHRSIHRWIIAAGFSMLLSGQAAHAASGSWNVDAAGSWATASNWNPTSAPGATSGTTNTDVATFSNTLTADRIVTVDANRNIGGITFSNSSASKFTLSGGNLLLTNAGVIQTAAGNGNHTDTISTAIAIQGDGGAATFTAGATSAASLLSIAAVTGASTGSNITALTLNGANTGGNIITGIVGDGAGGGKLAITKSDTGTWILAANNTYTGGTTINAGTLQIGNNTATGTLGTGSVTDNGTLEFYRSGTSLTVSNTISGSGGLTVYGTGGITITGTAANTFTGSTFVYGGNGGNSLTLNNSAGNAIGGNMVLGSGSTAGAVFLSQSNQIADSSIISMAGTVVNARGILHMEGYSETIGGLQSLVTGGGVVDNFNSITPNTVSTLTLNVTSGSYTFSGRLRDQSSSGGTLGIVKTGSGTQVLSGLSPDGPNIYTGGTSINGGVLSVAGSGALGGGNVIFGGGTLQYGNSAAAITDYSSKIVNSVQAITIDTNGQSVTFGSALTSLNSGGLTKLGAGTLTLSGANTYSGNTTVNSGTLALVGSGSIAASPNISVANGATLDVSGLSAAFTLGGSQTLSLGGSGATINGAINFSSSGTVSLVFDGTNPSWTLTTGAITLSASTVVNITATNGALSPGVYKIIAKSAGGTVTGTAPTSATVVSGATTYKYAYALSISGGELYLTVTARDHCIVVMGSSVAQGFGSSSSLLGPIQINGSDTTGYAGLLQNLLTPDGYVMNNISIGGQKTQDGLNRFATDLAPLSPTTKFAWLGYSCANEFLAGSEFVVGSSPAQVVATFTTNLSALIAECRSSGFTPIIGLNYPSNPYTALDYQYLKQANLTLNSWNVPSANFLGALDDGNGHWVSGYYYNDQHPNDAGHLELFYTIVPTLFDAINAGMTNSPQLAATTNFARLTQNLGVTAPITFTPGNTMHSFTISFRVRSTNDGTIAAIGTTGANYATLEIRSGNLVYRSPGGQEVATGVSVADGGWHDVALAFRYALQLTAVFVDGALTGTLTEQYVPNQFTLGGPSASGRPATPAVADFQNWCVYRSAWNIGEAVAQMQGNLQQASMEICAGLDDAAFTTGTPAANRAQSLSVGMVNTSNLVAAQDVPAPSNLSIQSLPGSSAGLTWTRNSTTESGFVVQRRPTGTTLWSDLVSLPAGSTAYTDTGLAIGVSYDYRVAASQGGLLRGNYSNIASIVTGLGVHQTILVDFGPNDGTNGIITASPDYLGQYWNNFVGTGGGGALSAISLPNLVTTTNSATTIGLNSSATGWAANGILNGGLLTPSYALLGNFAVASATEDYFLTTNTAASPALLTITNLDSTASYRLRFFGTRNTTETRKTQYTVTGGNGPFNAILTTSGSGIGAGGYNGNNNTIATISGSGSGVTPNGSGQIQVGVSLYQGSYAHLGIMELWANHSPVAQALSFTTTVGQNLSVDVINGANAPTDADGDGLTVTAVSGPMVGGGTATTNGGTGFTYAATVPGTNQFSYTVSDPYGGTATNTVTVNVQWTYEAWAAANGITGAAFGAISSNGIPNGIEYAIGANPNAFNVMPTLVPSGSNYTITFPKGAEAATDPKIMYAFEVSPDLSQWTQVAPTTENSISVSFTLTPSGSETKNFVRLKIIQLP